ncbi:hypothetical protein Goklo_009211 [Gossypium klotzschianum]|uniref:Uncharacterized protein n=1 Tax=Gossypium klotzschianum TaxID=34286 RepID=A0A7J8V272_9ROSI|nr:hypothetical protein [Gossypium klotzschianum]
MCRDISILPLIQKCKLRVLRPCLIPPPAKRHLHQGPQREFSVCSSSGLPIPSEMERATEKVKNKEFADVDSDAMGGGWMMIYLHGDDVEINMDGTYPDICFSEGVHDLINQSMKQTVVVKLLIGYRGPRGRLKSFWDREPRGL